MFLCGQVQADRYVCLDGDVFERDHTQQMSCVPSRSYERLSVSVEECRWPWFHEIQSDSQAVQITLTSLAAVPCLTKHGTMRSGRATRTRTERQTEKAAARSRQKTRCAALRRGASKCLRIHYLPEIHLPETDA